MWSGRGSSYRQETDAVVGMENPNVVQDYTAVGQRRIRWSGDSASIWHSSHSASSTRRLFGLSLPFAAWARQRLQAVDFISLGFRSLPGSSCLAQASNQPCHLLMPPNPNRESKPGDHRRCSAVRMCVPVLVLSPTQPRLICGLGRLRFI